VLRLPLPRGQRRLQIWSGLERRHAERNESGADEDRTGAAGGDDQASDAAPVQQTATEIGVA
jgi:hypothetical protein